MTIVKHELRRGKLSLLIWSASIAFMLGICVLFFPEMENQMEQVSSVFADMGNFSAAFGMDRLNFGEFLGFFCVECGNILCIGGAMYAALLGITALSGEEKEHTAEYLLTHPVSRAQVITGKLLAVVVQITALNLINAAVTALMVMVIGETPDTKTLALLFLSYYLLQLNIAAITFGISAFLRRGSLGIGLGLALGFYFVNIIANLTEDAKVLKYITPFSYTEGADIVAEKALELPYLAAGLAMAVIGIAAAYYQYSRKDIS